MPLDTKDAMLSSGLNQPVQPPSQGMSNFQAISGVNPGMNYGMPFSSGSTISNSGTTFVNTANPGDVRAQDFNQVGGNVAGLFGRQQQDAEESKTFIPEAPDPVTEETNKFIEAMDEGYTVEDGTRSWGINLNQDHLDELGLERKGEAGTKRAARLAKREDKYQDRKARRDAFKEMKADGMKGRDARQIKRQMRKGAKATRKEAWKTYKGERDLRAQDEAYKLQQQYSQ